ncbi:MAG: hypothetical protein LBF60_10095 [Treponema sp.]|jgi:IS30 family transposase|nr:hypothetical protein [Treponema sp.]
MPDKVAAALNKSAVRDFKATPPQKRNTLTLDNGKEFAGHKSLSQALGLNEHTNGLIRQYPPKKIPFDTLTQKELDKIVDKINNRPRKL